jgi:hypothetical protein
MKILDSEFEVTHRAQILAHTNFGQAATRQTSEPDLATIRDPGNRTYSRSRSVWWLSAPQPLKKLVAELDHQSSPPSYKSLISLEALIRGRMKSHEIRARNGRRFDVPEHCWIGR